MARKIVELTETQRQRFDKCWWVYVQKRGKGQAEVTWAKYDFDEAMSETIYQGILEFNRQIQTKSMSQEERRFIPHFSTWLNDKGWVLDVQKEAPKREAKKCKCGNELKINHRVGDECIKCYDDRVHPDFKRKVYENLCQHNLGKLKTETREEWMQRMRNVGREVIAKHYGK
jgi:ubiquitin